MENLLPGFRRMFFMRTNHVWRTINVHRATTSGATKSTECYWDVAVELPPSGSRLSPKGAIGCYGKKWLYTITRTKGAFWQIDIRFLVSSQPEALSGWRGEKASSSRWSFLKRAVVLLTNQWMCFERQEWKNWQLGCCTYGHSRELKIPSSSKVKYLKQNR